MKRSSSNLSFIDFLFNLLLVFVSLFVLSFLLINPTKNEKTIDPTGQYVIIMTWPDEFQDDIDLWVEDPQRNIVCWNRRESGLMHLDRDDLGKSNDYVKTREGKVEVKQNQEIVTLRGVIPGEYTVNAHMYRKTSKTNAPVSIKVFKIKPYKSVMERTIEIQMDDQEITFGRFTLDADGKVLSTNELPKGMVRP